MRSNIFAKALRLALLSMFTTSLIIGLNSCRDEFDEKEALELEHAFLLQLQSQRDLARQNAFADSVQAAQAAAAAAATQRLAEIELQARLDRLRDSLYLIGGSINYAVNVVDGNSTTFSGNASNNRVSTEDMSGFAVTVFHQETGEVVTETTGPSGLVSFRDLRVGKVSVNILKPGFTPVNYVADITPSSPFERPTSVGTGDAAGDPNGYVRSAGTVIPVFEIELGNVFDGTTSVPTAELNRYSTITGKMNVETDLTNFTREVAPAGSLINVSIDGNRPEFLQVINRATNNTFGSQGQVNANNNEVGAGNNINDGAEGDGRVIQLSYSDATFTGVSQADGTYTVIVPAFPTGAGLPVRVNHSVIAADQRLYDVIGVENNANGGTDPVYGVVTKRTVFDPAFQPAPAPTTGPAFVPVVDALDVSVAPPFANVDGSGASARAYIRDSDGGIDRVVITNGGHGYYAAPYVWIKHPNDAFQNAGEGNVVDIIASFDASNTNYNDDRARATATVQNGVVTGINVTYAGQGYYSDADGDGLADPIEVIFIQHGVQPTFTATINVGGGCVNSGTTWSVNGAFTQAPRIISVAVDAGVVPNGFTNLLSTSAANGVGTVTLTTADGNPFCGFTPNANITITVGSAVTSMLKLRPVVAQEGGSIGPLTIAEGQYFELGIADDVISNDVATGATTTEEVMNGLYTQAPQIRITGAGNGATAVANLNTTSNRVESISVTNAGSGYDRANTTIEVRSSVRDANGNSTLSAFQAKFVPVGGASTLTANTTTTSGQGTFPNGGTFYTTQQFTDFNANNASNNLVTLEALYDLDNNVATDPVAVAALTQSNTALEATPAGTPLNVFYSMRAAQGTSTVATADTDVNDTNPVAPTTVGATNQFQVVHGGAGSGIATPGINFADGGEGYSEESEITITAPDAANTRTPQAQSNAAQPIPGDFFDQAQFDYSLAEGYVVGVELNSTTTLTTADNPIGIVLGELDLTGGGTTATADNPVAASGTLGNPDFVPNNTQSILGVNVTATPGQGNVSTTSGTGIQRIRPVTGSNGGRFAQTPELQITGAGSGFEPRFVMNFEHAIQPVLGSFITTGYSFFLFNTGAAAPAPLDAAIGSSIVVRFTDNQAPAPATPAVFQATFTIGARGDLDGGAGNEDVRLDYQQGTFAGTNFGGAGYNVSNINTMRLEATEVVNAAGTVTLNVSALDDRPQLLVDNNDGTLDQVFTATGGDVTVEGLSSITLGGRIVEIVADNGRSGTGYAQHPSTNYTIVPTGYSENVPTSAQLGVAETGGATGIVFTGSGSASFEVTASGDGFPFVKGVANREFIRLKTRGGAIVPTSQVSRIRVARRIGYVAFRQVPAGVTVYQSFDPTLTLGVPAGGVTALGAIATIAPGTIGFTGREGQGGATVAAGTAGKTVSAVDADNNGTSDYWAFVGNGYATPNITLTIADRAFANGAPDDAARAEVRSSGLRIGSVTIKTGVVHPIVATRDPANPERSITAPVPTFRFTFATPGGTPTFGTASRAGDANGRTAASYAYRAVSGTEANYMLEQVDITSGGANYSAAPFFRVVPKASTRIGGTASGSATAAAGAVTGVTITNKGAYGSNDGTPGVEDLPWVVLNDYIRKLYLREEGTNNPALKLNGVGTLSSIIVDNAGAGYTAGTTPALMVVPKGEDFNDQDNDGIYDGPTEFKEGGVAATVTINAGADLANLTPASFTITPGDGYTQDPDIVVNTHLRHYIAIPRFSDNPVFVTTDQAGNLRAFVVENNSSSNFRELPFSLADVAPADGIIDLTAAWAGGVNQGTRPILTADLNNIFSVTTGGNRATNRTNEGVISAITVTNAGDGLVAGTYPLVFFGGGPNAGGAAATVTVSEDGVVSAVNLTSGGASYDDSYVNPGADGILVDDPATGVDESADNFVGVRVIFPMGAGAAAEAITTPFTVDKIEVVTGGSGYADEPFAVRVVPTDAQLDLAITAAEITNLLGAGAADNAANRLEAFLQDPELAENIVETRVSGVTVDATTGAITGITVDPNNRGAGYNAAPRVIIEDFRAVLRREAMRTFMDDAGGNQAGQTTFNFEEYVTAKVAVEVDGATGAISKVDVINPGFGYIANPEIRVIGLGSGADLTAGGIDFVGGTAGQQTGVGDYYNFGSYFLGSTALGSINFADHRLGSVTITDGGSGYLGGNFPRNFQPFQATLGNGSQLNLNVPAGVSTVHDIYYGTGQRNISEDTDTGSGAGRAAGDDQ